MIGLPELIILIVIVLIVFGGYFRKRLPEFGRKAGEGARVGTEKARELVDSTSGTVSEKVGDHLTRRPSAARPARGCARRASCATRSRAPGRRRRRSRPSDRTRPKPDPEAPATPADTPAEAAPADEPAEPKS